jgi:hypothetical protein
VIPKPYNVFKLHRKKKTPGLANDFYFALVARANEVGANDLDEKV